MYIARSVTTWSLRERAVCRRPPTGPDDLGQAPLDRHVDVFVVGLEREAPLAQLARHRVETGEQRVAVLGGDDPALGEHARVCARLRDVLRP